VAVPPARPRIRAATEQTLGLGSINIGVSAPMTCRARRTARRLGPLRRARTDCHATGRSRTVRGRQPTRRRQVPRISLAGLRIRPDGDPSRAEIKSLINRSSSRINFLAVTAIVDVGSTQVPSISQKFDRTFLHSNQRIGRCALPAGRRDDRSETGSINPHNPHTEDTP
jgi:hypothetical protein